MDFKKYMEQLTKFNETDTDSVSIKFGFGESESDSVTTDRPAKNYTFAQLYNMVNPETGKRYVIPYLSPADPKYKEKYVDMMRTKLDNPSFFEKIIRGE